ncbi:MAG: hypothetical protein JOZ31_01635 [Verrucomicrobia bacterium]|nr:hypothetical protein [Verrucomicrobiota bacterium]MBV8485698.1 hypothetical protein [Verrucomicrobiota bacterium]
MNLRPATLFLCALLASCATTQESGFITVPWQPANVGDAGFGDYAKLFMVPNGGHFASAVDFKTPARSQIERLGYKARFSDLGNYQFARW